MTNTLNKKVNKVAQFFTGGSLSTAKKSTSEDLSPKALYTPPVPLNLNLSDMVPTHNTIKPSNPLIYQQLTSKKSHIEFVANTTVLEPYEKFTSIRSTRPELLTLLNFEPLFIHGNQSNSNNSTTDIVYNIGECTKHGRYCLTQYTAQKLMLINQISVARSVRDYSDKWKNTEQNKVAQFKQSVNELKDIVATMQQILKYATFAKQQLDLREQTHKFKLSNGADTWNKDFMLETVETNNSSGQELNDILEKNVSSLGSIVNTLVDYGYDVDIIRKYWSSTKIWLQFLIEYKATLETHSEQLAELPTDSKRKDISALVLQSASSNRFQIFRGALNILPLKELKNYNSARAEEVVSSIATSYGYLYNNVKFTSNEVKLSLLINMLSKEFRYSRGMVKQSARMTIQRNFGQGAFYQSAVPELFDSIIGSFGSNISEVPSNALDDLASMAYYQPTQNSVVMTFENKYLDVLSNHFKLSPASKYYVDSLFKLNAGNVDIDSSKLEQLIYRFDSKYHAISTLGFDLNFVGQFYEREEIRNFADRSMECADRLAAEMFDFLLYRGDSRDGNDGTIKSVFFNSPLTGLMSYASRDNSFKAMMFAFIMNKVLRSYPSSGREYDDTSLDTYLDDKLLDMMTKKLSSILPKLNNNVTVSNDGFVRFAMSFTELKTLFSKKNSAFFQLQGFMHMFYDAWSFNNAALDEITVNSVPNGTNVRTRYNGILDTSIMMIAFDVLVNMFANYGNVQLDAIKQKNSGNSTIPDQLILKSKPSKFVNFAVQRDIIENKLKREKALLSNSFITILGVLDNIKRNFQALLNLFNDKHNKQVMNRVFELTGSDQELFDLLFSEQQMLITQSLVADISSEIFIDNNKENSSIDQVTDSDQFYKLLDFSLMTSKSKDELLTLMYDTRFASEYSKNVCVATVGIPVGYVDNIKSVIKLGDYEVIEGSFNSKQTDIVSVNIYKTDVRYPDIIFKPIKHLFELSRFPVRNTRLHLPLSQHATFQDVLSCVPTRDLSQNKYRSSDLITFYSEQAVIAFKGSTTGYNVALAFADEQYSFLSNDQKKQVYENHVLSYLADLYFKVMTGLNVSEHMFIIKQPNDLLETLVPTNMFKDLLKTKLAQDVDARKNRSSLGSSDYLFANNRLRQVVSNITRVPVNKNVSSIEESLSKISSINIEEIVNQYFILSSMNRSLSTYSDEKSFMKKILLPKKFDRVFNVFFDPDNFQIDEFETNKSLVGKQAIKKMIEIGEINIVSSNSTTRKNISKWSNLSLKTSDKGAGDVTFEKYFVTVEPLNSEVL